MDARCAPKNQWKHYRHRMQLKQCSIYSALFASSLLHVEIPTTHLLAGISMQMLLALEHLNYTVQQIKFVLITLMTR